MQKGMVMCLVLSGIIASIYAVIRKLLRTNRQ